MFFLISCSVENNFDVQNLGLNDNKSFSLDSNALYFPIGNVIVELDYPPSEIDTAIVKSYSKFLFNFNEDILHNSQNKNEIYRFTWLRTFHRPIMIRVDNDIYGKRIFWKISDGKGGYIPGNLIESKMRFLREIEWNKFQSLLLALDYWDIQSIDPNERGYDGSSWLLEGLKSENYHIAERWGGGDSTYYNCCKYLIELTDLEINNMY